MDLKINVSKRSSRFSEVRYDGLHLEVVFRNSDNNVVKYIGVSQMVFEQFIGSQSMGKYYDDLIQDRYVRIREVEVSVDPEERKAA